MEDLTPRQRRIMAFIRETVLERGYPPTVREIGEAVGLTSSSSVHSQIANLERRGLLHKDPTKPRAIGLAGPPPTTARDTLVPVLGRIAAGVPLLADQNVEDRVPIPAMFLSSGENFALRVAGDSMNGAAILDGDLVVVRRQDDADDGDVIAALVPGPAEDEATVKRLSRRANKVLLLAENPAYGPIELGEGRVLGKITAVLRRL